MRGPASEAEAAPDDSVRIRGIIADARLYDGARAGETLDAHLEASPLVRGVREIGLWDPSSEIDRADEASSLDLYGESRFRAGFEELAKRGLSFDAHQYHTQLPAVATLARAFPDTPIVINHLGSPLGAGPYAGRHDEFFPEWSRNVEEVATCPNVHMKLGGLAMPWSGFDWHERTKPPSSDDFVTTYHRYYDHALQVFGPERCMFESNFPVDKLSLSYDVLWNAFKKIAAPYSENERDALFSETAKRVYRLEDT
jgi:predicted TIM-barrel fold metal-dependent hydrolase